MAESTLKQRFEAKVQKTETCHLWTGSKNKKGYGMIATTRSRSITAHRASYLLYKGEIPQGVCVLHSCDNPSCVNPEHLSLGSHDDNVQDKVSKGRQARGVTHRKAKLTPTAVKIIREAYGQGFRMFEIAAYFQIAHAAIRGIVTGQNWKHV